jgi:hypothetical protein
MRFPVRIRSQYRMFHLTEFSMVIIKKPHKALLYYSNDNNFISNQKISEVTTHIFY